MKIFIKGIGGNMGQRYAACCRWLKYDVYGSDAFLYGDPAEADRIIIATPTKNHVNDIIELAAYNKPILCEKPITTASLRDLTTIEKKLKTKIKNLSMVNQYAFLYVERPTNLGMTKINWYRTGNDGKYWDCINLIGMSITRPEILTNSPIWAVKLNGQVLKKKFIDDSYLAMIQCFVETPKKYPAGWDYIKLAHEKAVRWFLA